MQVSVSLLPVDRLAERVEDAAAASAVVIDVLRATSVMATAFANGATAIYPTTTVDEAFRCAESLRKEGPVLLCGERECRRIDGFDLGNSPAEYAAEIVQDRSLVMTTTNGTRALSAVAGFGQIVTASFLNRAAVIDRLCRESRVHLCCAGTDRQVTGEDTLLAGSLIAELQRLGKVQFANDQAEFAASYWRRATAGGERLAEVFAQTLGGSNLVRLGMGDDLERCAQVDTFAVCPTFRLQGHLVGRAR